MYIIDINGSNLARFRYQIYQNKNRSRIKYKKNHNENESKYLTDIEIDGENV